MNADIMISVMRTTKHESLISTDIMISLSKQRKQESIVADRRRKKNPKRHQLCLRLTDRQHELLEAYSGYKGFDTGVDAIRSIIDGLDGWLRRQEAKNAASGQPPVVPAHSGLSSAASDVTGSDGASDGANDAASDVTSDVTTDAPGDGTSDDASDVVGDFAGRPSVGLPNPGWHDGE